MIYRPRLVPQIHAISTPNISFAFQEMRFSASSASSFNFTSCLLGTAAANRMIAIAIGATAGGGSAFHATSVQIGGAACSLVIDRQDTDASTASSAEIWRGSIAAGATAQVDLTFSGTMRLCTIGIWAAYMSSHTPTNSGVDGDPDPMSIVATVPSPGFAIAVAGAHQGAGTNPFTSSNMTKMFDQQGNLGCGAGWEFTTSATITANGAPSGTNESMVYASWSLT